MNIRLTPLFSSSSGNSYLISAGETNILVDAGVTGSQLTQALQEVSVDPHSINGIIITHEHVDHIKGVGVMSRKFDIPIYANALTWEQMEDKVGDIALKNQRVVDKTDFFIKDLCIMPFSVSHDAADPVGYSLGSGNNRVSILTDTGKVTENMLDAIEGSSLVVLEANHDIEMLRNGPYPYALKQRIMSNKGHLSNMTAAGTALELYKRGVRCLILGHISSHNNKKILAFRTVAGFCEKQGIEINKDLFIISANRTSVTGTFKVGSDK